MKKLTIPEVLPLIKEYLTKPNNGAGGELHIVFDDMNIKDTYIKYCIENSTSEDTKKIGSLLLQMSKTQRLKICHLI